MCYDFGQIKVYTTSRSNSYCTLQGVETSGLRAG